VLSSGLRSWDVTSGGRRREVMIFIVGFANVSTAILILDGDGW
jgi:hypothetical protein